MPNSKKISLLIIGLIINSVWSFPQAPQQQQQHAAPIEIISKSEDTLPDGSFNSSYESSDGTKVENHGYFKRIQVPQYEDANGKTVEAHEEDVFVQTGSYSYYDPEGNVIQLQYIADENGFQPTGDHLPKPTEQATQHQQQIQPQLQQQQKYQQQYQQLNQERPIQNQYSRRTRQSYYTAEPGLGIVENRPINDYRSSSSLPYSTNPLRYIRQQLYQDRPIYQGYYPSNGGLSSGIQSRPSYPGYNQNGGLSTTVISRPSYQSGYYGNGGLSETIHTSPSNNAYYYYNPNCLPNTGLSANVETKPSYPSGGLSETIVTKPSYSLCYYPNNGGISESITTNPSYNQNGGLSGTVITNPSYPNGGISETVEAKPSYNPCYYYPGVSALPTPPNQHPCYNQNGGISESIIANPSPSFNQNHGIGETIESKPSNQQGFSSSGGNLISGSTKTSHDVSKFQRLGSIDNVPINTDAETTTASLPAVSSSHLPTASS